AEPGTPFSTVMDAAPHPFVADRYVVRVGVATKAKTGGERKPSALVFLVDVSGSMDSADKLGLAKQALHVLTDNIAAKDAVSIVTYAG
ncbi:VWA domain-containing protein, partial [Escherichia coli]|nr:VWA domain-containing protein [Escherichia coli]